MLHTWQYGCVYCALQGVAVEHPITDTVPKRHLTGRDAEKAESSKAKSKKEKESKGGTQEGTIGKKGTNKGKERK